MRAVQLAKRNEGRIWALADCPSLTLAQVRDSLRKRGHGVAGNSEEARTRLRDARRSEISSSGRLGVFPWSIASCPTKRRADGADPSVSDTKKPKGVSGAGGSAGWDAFDATHWSRTCQSCAVPGIRYGTKTLAKQGDGRRCKFCNVYGRPAAGDPVRHASS